MNCYAASVVGPGRTFLRGLNDALPHVAAPHHYIRPNTTARAWWIAFIEQWNGISVLPKPQPEFHFSSNASGSVGCGAAWGAQWFQIIWSSEWLEENISTKELLPIAAAVAIWGRHRQGNSIRCHCDNMAVVSAINSGRDK